MVASAPVAVGSTGALESLLRQAFPQAEKGKRASLVFESILAPTEPAPRFVFASMRLVQPSEQGAGWSQEVPVCYPSDLADVKRLGAYVQAWRQMVDEMIAAAQGPLWWTPFNLAAPQILLTGARSVDDFKRALQQRAQQGRLSL